VPINHQKEWSLRIILDNLPRPSLKKRSSVFDRLGSAAGKQKILIPKKSVFSRIKFDLSRVLTRINLQPKVTLRVPLIAFRFLIV
jgi:hypothetical protein